MAKVFISHASASHMLAGEVHGWLIDAGHEVFLDCDLRDGIAVGEEWERRLYERLRWADAVVCVVTSEYLASLWCTAELGSARSQNNRVLPLYAEPDVVHPLLNGIQGIDYWADPVKARAALVEALRRVELGWPPDRSPFPGLRPFKADEHRAFFGRTEEVRQLAEMLRSTAESVAVLVVGPSGCGKSSLLGAGLVPALNNEPDWRALPPLRPGADPVTALARELAAAARRLGLAWTVEHVRHQLDQSDLTGLADELLLADSRGPRRRLLIVIDQFEELLTPKAHDERHQFTELLRPALTGPVRVVATLRSEFLDQLRLDPDLKIFFTETYMVRPLRREALRAVIEQPAQLAGIKVDDGLVDRLVEDTDTGQALPLLACTLAQLADGVTSDGRLSSARYDKLGGVHSALTRQADAALADAAGDRSREQLIAGLLRLVSVDELGRPTSRGVNHAELPEHVITDLNAFVARRLLTTDTDNGTAVIGVAHEALLSAWPPLAQAITDNAQALRARRAVEHAATEWHDNARPPARLWSGGQLAAAVTDTGARFVRSSASADAPPRRGLSRWLPWWRRILVTTRIEVSSHARDFLQAGLRRDRRRRMRTSTVLSVLLVIALTAAGVAYVQRDQVREQLEITTAQNLIAQAETVRDSDPRSALLYGIAAQHIHPLNGKALASLVRTLTTTPYKGTLYHHSKSPVKAVAFTPDERTLATGSAEGTVSLWDLNDSIPSQTILTTLDSPVTSLAFSTNARTLVTASSDGAVTLWSDLFSPNPHRLHLATLVGTVNSVAFSPDGHTLAAAGNDRTVTLWNVRDPAQPQRGTFLTDHGAPVWSVAFSPDGTTLATGDSEGMVALWDVTAPTQPRQSWQAHTGAVNSVTFSLKKPMLVTAGDDSAAQLWDLTAPGQPQPFGPPLSGHSSRVTAATLSQDGRTLATTSDDSSVIGWDITEPSRPRQLGPALISHSSKVTAATFASDNTLATACAEGVVILSNFSDLAQPSRSSLTEQPSPVDSVKFFTDGPTLAVTSSDDTVTRWDLTQDQPVRGSSQPRSNSLSDSLAVTPNGNTMVTAGDQGRVILWDRTDPSRPRRLGEPLPGHRSMASAAAFSADGRTLATGSDDGVMLWDLSHRNRPGALTAQPLTDHKSPVTAAVFSADGRTLATGHDDSQVVLWDLTDPIRPRPLGKPLIGDTGPVTSVAFAPNGNTLAAAGAKTTVILWDLTILTQLRTDAIGTACTITRGGLSPKEWEASVPGLPYQNTCAS